MEMKDRIKQKADELFRSYGIKSVTMDEIATRLGVSKKTIYQSFADKDELVDEVVGDLLTHNKSCCNKDRAKATDAIHEVFLAMEMVQQIFQDMNPVILYDMERNHPATFQKFLQHKNKFLFQVIKENIERGQKEELYRADINTDVIAKLRLETMMLPFNQEIFPKNKFNLVDLRQHLIEHFLFGVSNIKGHKLILKYQQQRKKPNKMKTNPAIKFLLFPLSFFAYSQSFAQQTNAFTAKQAVDYSLKNSAQVKNALIDIEIQRQTNKEITASAFPQINGTVSINDYLSIPTSLIPAEFFGGPAGTYAPIKFGTKYNATLGGNLQQILFDGQVFVGLQAKKTAIEFSTKTAEVTQEMIKANVYKIYYQLVVGYKQIESIDANISRSEKLLHDTREIYKNGFAEKLDVDKVEVQLNNLNTEKLKAQNQLEAGKEALKFLMSMPQKDELILTDSLTEEELKSNILDESYNYSDRKEFQLLTLNAKLDEFNIRRYKVSKLPIVSGFVNYNKNAQRQTFDFLKGNGDWFVTSIIGLTVNVPIFDGGARNARISKAKLGLQKTQNNIEQLKLSIDNDVEQARLKMKSALVTMESQKQNIQLAEQVYRTTKLKYEQGLGSNQEIYNAQTELKVAQNNYYSSLYDAITAKIDYLKAAGKL